MTAPAITLRAVTPDNFDAVIGLRVADEQSNFVAPNLYSLAETYVEPTYRPFAIYVGDDPVGFTMYGRDERTGEWWIMRLMIAHAHQAQGYGRVAMEALIALMIAEHGMSEIVTSFEPENDVAAKLYRRLGFVDTGEIVDDELVMRLDVSAVTAARRN